MIRQEQCKTPAINTIIFSLSLTKEEEYVRVYPLTPSPTKLAFRTISFKTLAVTSSSEHSDCIM